MNRVSMKSRWLLVLSPWLLFVRLTQGVSGTTNTSTSWRQSAIADLLSTFKFNALPPDNAEDPTEVEVALYIQSIGDVSAEKMEIGLDIMTWQRWQDPRLIFRPSIAHNLSRVELSSGITSKLWQPNLYLINEKVGRAYESVETNQLAHVYRNGTVVYSKRIYVTLSCPMLLYRYPHDIQRCPIRLSTYSYTKEAVWFKWRKIEPIWMNPTVHLSRYHLDGSPSPMHCELRYYAIGEFSCLETVIELKREFGYYVIQLYLPTMLIVVVSWLSFYLPVESVPARVSVGLITVLTMTTESTKARASLPHVSYVTAVDLWVSASMVFVFAAMLEYALVGIVYRRARRSGNQKQRNSISHSSSTDEAAGIQAKRTAASVPTAATESGLKMCFVGRSFLVVSDKRIDVIARVGFPVAYMCFQIIYWVVYLLTGS